MEDYMSIRTIQNDSIRISVNDQGAELCSMQDIATGIELVWTADPAHWNRHAPLLFPIVGKLAGNRYTYDDATYEMGGHGFARDSEFICISEEGNAIWHRLLPNEKTKAMYPFDFQLDVGHIINGKTLTCQWKVSNTGTQDLLFSIGGHTAFRCPVASGETIDDCWMKMTPASGLQFKQVNSVGSVRAETQALPLTDGFCKLDKHFFDEDVYIFEDKQISAVALAGKDKKPFVSIDFAGFPAVGIWAKPGAPFVCVEPWYGVADHEGCSGELEEKVLIQALAPDAIFDAKYTVTSLL